MLQDAPCTNAGLGSNLARDGTVECDASIMLGSGEFGAMGAVSGMPTSRASAACSAPRPGCDIHYLWSRRHPEPHTGCTCAGQAESGASALWLGAPHVRFGLKIPSMQAQHLSLAQQRLHLPGPLHPAAEPAH